MSDSLNFFSKALFGIEGGGVMPNRYADLILPTDGTQDTLEGNIEQSKAIKNKFLKDLGGNT